MARLLAWHLLVFSTADLLHKFDLTPYPGIDRLLPTADPQSIINHFGIPWV
jgi:hypothetical protein